MHSASCPEVRGLLVLLGMVTLVGMATADHLDHDRVKALREAGRILPMGVVLSHALAAQPGQLLAAELEQEDGRYCYEIKILDHQGRIHELDFDATSGARVGEPGSD